MNRTYKIILGILIIILIGISILFKITDVPDIDKGNSFDIEVKDNCGLTILYKMLKKKYGENQVYTEKEDDFSYLNGKKDHLLVYVNGGIGLDSTMVMQLDSFVSRGNDVLFISQDLYVPTFDWKTHIQTSYDTDSIYGINWPDCTRYTFKNHNELLRHLRITTINHFLEKSDTTDTSIDSTAVIGYENLAMLDDSSSILRKIFIDGGAIHYHTVPSLFTNLGILETDYRLNFNKTFALFDKSYVVIHQEKRANINAGLNEDSLLQYILSQPPLKYAYYLTLLLSLLFVFFASKRKQKEIPVLETSKNTSLEYIKTTSALFMAQGQNEKLVNHIKRNFYYKVKTAYYLDKSNPEFAELLAKKSRIPLDQIRNIIKQLNIVDNYAFNDDQLIRLYKDIDSFEKNRK